MHLSSLNQSLSEAHDIDRLNLVAVRHVELPLDTHSNTSTMEAETQPALRLRKKSSKDRQERSAQTPQAEDVPERDEVVWGKTPGGEGK